MTEVIPFLDATAHFDDRLPYVSDTHAVPPQEAKSIGLSPHHKNASVQTQYAITDRPARWHNVSTCRNSPDSVARLSLRKSEMVRKSKVLLAASTRIRSRRVSDRASDLTGTPGGLLLT